MKATVTVRIGRKAHRRLKEIADRTDESLSQVLDKAVEAYRRQCFLEQANTAYAALRRKKTAWKEEQSERQAWDATLGDGLEHD